MSSAYSSKRVYCADYLHKHKKKKSRTKDFQCVTRIGVDALKAVLGAERAGDVRESDMLCRNCFVNFQRLCESQQPSTSTSSNTSTKDDQFSTQDEAIDEINRLITSQGIGVTPVRKRKKTSTSYVKRKHSEISEALGVKARRQIEAAFDVSLPGTSNTNCQLCPVLLGNIRMAYRASKSLQQRCQILTLLPASMSERDVQAIVPEATRYMIKKSQKLVAEKDVWALPDPYERSALR